MIAGPEAQGTALEKALQDSLKEGANKPQSVLTEKICKCAKDALNQSRIPVRENRETHITNEVLSYQESDSTSIGERIDEIVKNGKTWSLFDKMVSIVRNFFSRGKAHSSDILFLQENFTAGAIKELAEELISEINSIPVQNDQFVSKKAKLSELGYVLSTMKAKEEDEDHIASHDFNVLNEKIQICIKAVPSLSNPELIGQLEKKFVFKKIAPIYSWSAYRDLRKLSTHRLGDLITEIEGLQNPETRKAAAQAILDDWENISQRSEALKDRLTPIAKGESVRV
jgi:hypothetical protein